MVLLMLFVEFFLHLGSYLFVEYFLVFFEGVVVVVATGEIPENDGEFLGIGKPRDYLEGSAIGFDEDKGWIALESTCELMGAAATGCGGFVGLPEPSEGVVALGIELHGVEVTVEDFFHCGVGEGLAVHFFAVSTPGGVEVNEVGLGADGGLCSLFNGVPF